MLLPLSTVPLPLHLLAATASPCCHHCPSLPLLAPHPVVVATAAPPYRRLILPDNFVGQNTRYIRMRVEFPRWEDENRIGWISRAPLDVASSAHKGYVIVVRRQSAIGSNRNPSTLSIGVNVDLGEEEERVWLGGEGWQRRREQR
ncbi:hypothetical protein BHM03_00041962 [Ensete ventricosum]|nr:hypothetical protein BHM03_00041962 [Ensete ventricosum]